MKPLTPAEMRELHAKSTRGIWKARQFDGEGWHYIFTSHPVVPELARIAGADNAASIVADHNNVLALLDRIEELERVLLAVQRAKLNGLFDASVADQVNADVDCVFAEVDAALPAQGETAKPGSKEGA